jgi:hypothetical protein
MFITSVFLVSIFTIFSGEIYNKAYSIKGLVLL